MFKRIAVAAAFVTAAFTGGAGAATLNGTFNIDIYNYNSGGVQANAFATDAVVVANAANLLKTITYTGDIDFRTVTGQPVSTILEFLTSAGGILSDAAGLDITLSTGSYQTTTLLDITGTLLGGIQGTIEHDDGISLFDDGVLVVDSSKPTSPIDTAYQLSSGNFRLIYSAANFNPEVLSVDASPIPLPAGGVLLLTALGGIGIARRRRKAA
jgi:hypothetical protein